MRLASDVTVVVPTLNRPHFVSRMLRVFLDMGFGGHLLIGDSSTADHFDETQDVIATLQPSFRVTHRACPGLPMAECVGHLASAIDTPYVVLMPDDDLPVAATLQACAQFLDQHPAYSSAGGHAILAEVAEGSHGHVRWTASYPIYRLEANTAAERLIALCQAYSVLLYAVSRTDQFVKRFQPAARAELSDIAFAAELLPVCLQAVQGKVRMLPRLFVVRQVHRQRYLRLGIFDWITQPDWASSYQVFEHQVAQEMVRQDGLKLEEARAIVKRAFQLYVIRKLRDEWDHRDAHGHRDPRVWARRVAQCVPGARWCWRSVRSWRHPGADCTLPSLLRPSSPYHDEFLPIYRVMTTPPVESHELARAP